MRKMWYEIIVENEIYSFSFLFQWKCSAFKRNFLVLTCFQHYSNGVSCFFSHKYTIQWLYGWYFAFEVNLRINFEGCLKQCFFISMLKSWIVIHFHWKTCESTKKVRSVHRTKNLLMFLFHWKLTAISGLIN